MWIGRVMAIAALTAGLAVAPAHGGTSDNEDRHLSDEIDRAFRELMDRMRPALEEFLETLEVLQEIDGLENYQRPEVLPNGDIIIRRREDAPPLPPREEPAPDPGVRT